MSSPVAAAADGAYQGAPGAFSEEAALALLGVGASLLPCRTLEDVFAAVAAGRARSAVVPIENSLAGSVPGCADLIGRHAVRVVAERVQPIVHALIAAPGTALERVRHVRSHPVALAQCERFFREHPLVTPIPVFDTAGAVAEIMTERTPDGAAIASSRAAALHGGVVLADGIQDSHDNFTRFLRIDPGAPPDRLRADWKTSLVCTLPNSPGALVRALESFAAHGLNLIRIESRPIRETPFEYRFYLDLAPHGRADPDALESALGALQRHCLSARVLGNFPQHAATPE